MRLTVVGCSPAWPNPGGAHSGYLLEGSGAVMLDCGPGVLGRLRERAPWPVLDAIVITHFHLDHWGDLVPWARGRAHIAAIGVAPVTPQLWVPPGGTEWLRQVGALSGYPQLFERAFELHEYGGGAPFEVAGYTVTATRVPHYRLEAYALRATDGRRTLAYSGDAGPSDALGETARDADLFVCEATLMSGELDGTPRGHLSLDEALDAFERSGAKRLLVTHRPEEFPTGAELELAHDGLVQDV